MQLNENLKKGRGAQKNTKNRFSQNQYGHFENKGLDYIEDSPKPTQFFKEHPKTILNKVTSPDLPFPYSLNPYQGCEHGCVYCYARNSHEYWGFSAGEEFEQKIIIKQNADNLLEKMFQSKQWKCAPITLSGNTDCYQPIERKQEITRRILALCLKYKNPVSIITKNKLILRDTDHLQKLNECKLVKVYISITGTDESLRAKLEPRTATYKTRFEVIEKLSRLGIPVGVMNAPIIPGLNDQAMYEVLRQASLHGAKWAGYTTVRLNGAVSEIFSNWLEHAFPLKANKIISLISDMHNGVVSNSTFGKRMHGTGNIAAMIKMQFEKYTDQFRLNQHEFTFNTSDFLRYHPGQLSLF